MNLLVIATRDFKPLHGGVAEYTHNICAALNEPDLTVTVLSKIVDGYKNFDKNCPYRIIRKDLKQSRHKVHLFEISEIKKAINQTLIDNPPSMIISNKFTTDTRVALDQAQKSNIPHLLIAYGLELGFKYPHKVEKHKERVFRESPKIICISNYTRDLVVQKYNLDINNIILALPGLHLCDLPVMNESKAQSRKSLNLPEDSQIILSLGRLVERKGFDMVLKAMSAMLNKMPDIKYVIAGDGPVKENLRKIIKDLKLTEHVDIMGFVDDDTKYQLYNSADVFVMPNRTLPNGDVEGFGIVFLEANYYECPVVGGRSGGAVDAIEHGKSGLLVDPYDLEDIQNALLDLLKNKEKAKKMGKYRRERVLRDFDWKVIGKKLKSELKALLR